MRAVVIGDFYPESFAANVASELAALGNDVARLTLGAPKIVRKLRMGDVWTQARLLKARNNPLVSVVHREFRRQLHDLGRRDLVITTYDHLSADDVDEIKASTGARVAVWFPDALSNWHRALFLNAAYDGVFLKDPYVVNQLREFTRVPAFYLPECFSPVAYEGFRSNTIADRFRVDVATVGNCYTYRVAALAGLAKFNTRIWGGAPARWMRTGALSGAFTGEYVANLVKAQAFRGAKIVVNSLHPAEIWGINARAFEVAGCGGFQLISWRPGLSQLFVDGEELVSYASATELESKIDEFLARPMRRARIARAGRERARRDHVYASRLKLLISTITGDAAGFDMPELSHPGKS